MMDALLPVVYVKLTESEIMMLQTALSVRLIEMRNELAHADAREFRDGLREDLNTLEEIDRKLTEALRRQRLRQVA